MNIKLFSQKMIMATLCALSLQSAIAQSDFTTTCPSVDYLESLDGALQFTNILGYNTHNNTMLGSLVQIEKTSKTESYMFTMSGFSVTYGANIDDSAHAAMHSLQLDSTTPVSFQIAANRKDKGDHLTEDGPINVCSYSVPSNPQIKALFHIIQVAR